jgi:hypothetical protein
MANSENTAVNDLIAAAADGEASSAVPRSIATPRVHAKTLPLGSLPVTAPADHAQGTPLPPRHLSPHRQALVAEPTLDHAPSAAAYAPSASGAPSSLSPRALLALAEPRGRGGRRTLARQPPERLSYTDLALTQPWHPVEPELDWRDQAQFDRGLAEQHIATMQVSGQSRRRSEPTRLVLPAVLLMLLGVLTGIYIAVDRGGDASPAAPVAAAPAPAGSLASAGSPAVAAPIDTTPPDVVTPAPVAVPDPALGVLVDVRIDSSPNGATVMLVDRGKAQYLGTTPLTAAVDPSREYDVIFTYPSHTTQIEHLDARVHRRIEVTLVTRGGAAAAAAPRGPTPSAMAADPPIAAAPEKDGGSAAPARRRPRAPAESSRRAPRPAARLALEAPTGEGTLMVSSKPPCEIFIDGQSTGLTTPQRSLTLSAGRHRITLVNTEHDIRKTIGVQITAGATERVIEDLMAE